MSAAGDRPGLEAAAVPPRPGAAVDHRRLHPPRLRSVDVLRGITVAAMLLVNTPGDWSAVYAPLLHSEWHGCTPTDLVFPFFLFLVGVSITLGVVPRMESGMPVATLQRQVLLRALRIVALGVALNLAAWLLLDLPHLRAWGVLQRIGLCFAFAGWLALHAGARTQWAVLAALLLGWWALLVGGGGVEAWSNIASRVDTHLLGPLVYAIDPASGRGHDPEGLPSTLGALATTVLGLRAGAWLRAGRVRALCIAGVGALLLAAAWSQVLPFNKNLWTSSYVAWSGGWAMLALAACHVLVDVRGWPPVGRTFGVNAIAAYAGSGLMTFVLIAIGAWTWIWTRLFATPLTPLLGAKGASLAFAIAFVALWWLVLKWMDRRRWYLRI